MHFLQFYLVLTNLSITFAAVFLQKMVDTLCLIHVTEITNNNIYFFIFFESAYEKINNVDDNVAPCCRSCVLTNEG